MAGSANTYVAGCVKAQPIQLPIPSLPPNTTRALRWSTTRNTSAPTSTGSDSNAPIAVTSADHENSGTRRIDIPGARVVSTDVAIDTAAAISPSAISTRATRNRSTMSAVAAADAAVVGERHDHEDESGQPAVEPGERQPRERQRTGAELEWHDRDRQPDAERHQRGGDEPDPVQLEQLRDGVDCRAARRCRRRVRCRAARRAPPSTRDRGTIRRGTAARSACDRSTSATRPALPERTRSRIRHGPHRRHQGWIRSWSCTWDSLVGLVGVKTSNGHGGPTRPDTTCPPAPGRKSRTRSEHARFEHRTMSRHTRDGTVAVTTHPCVGSARRGSSRRTGRSHR